MSLFITFEGGEGCGKTVQSKSLYRRLSQQAIPAVLTHEPGITPLGKGISRWLKWAHKIEISPLSELLLFNASRAQLTDKVIKPNLKSGKVVICDRYADSTTAYQGYGRGLNLGTVNAANNVATQGLKPDMTVLLDLPVEKGLARKNAQRQDRFEQEDITFHKKVREGYLKLASDEPRRWLVVDASQSRAKIGQIIWEKVSQLLSQRGLKHE